MKKVLFFSLGVALALSSCTKTDGTTPSLEGEVTFTSSINSAVTRVTETDFEDGDAISVFASDGDSYVAENVEYVFSSALFSSTSPIVSSGSELTFTALYPYTSDLSLSGAITLEADQSTEAAYEASDILGAVTSATSETCPELIFTHSLSAIQININSPKEVSAVTINALTAVDYDLASLSFTASGAAVGVTPLPLGDDSYQAVVAPQTFAVGTAFLELTIDGTTSVWNINSAIELTSGHKYVCTVTITSDDVIFTGSIVPWSDGDEIDITISESEEPFSGGKGTESSPYLISTAEDLAEISQLVAGADKLSGLYFLVTNDIDLKGSEDNLWTPIGYRFGTAFEGYFDGGGHLISGLYINTTLGGSGLIGYARYGEVKNVGVKGTITGFSYVGGVVGYSASDITNCYNMCNITGTSNYVGGVVGYNNSSTVSDCYNTGNVTGEVKQVGGVIGYNNNAPVTNCYNTGDVTGTGINVGGVMGYNSSSTISTCYNTGDVLGKGGYTGGIIGYNSYSSVSDCYNTGNITGEATLTGGVIGYSLTQSSVSSCYNTGTISGTTYVGGVVANNYGSSAISSCYNLGTVTGEGYVGGVSGNNGDSASLSNCYNMGKVEGTDSNIGGVSGVNGITITMSSCYNAGAVSGDSNVGGLLGSDQSGGTYNNCYWLTGTAASDSYGTEKSESEMKDSEMVTLLNAEQDPTVWVSDANADNLGFPILGWQ
ncbi:MAG: fimbrillin family protein [Rikenellaceae bacterium]